MWSRVLQSWCLGEKNGCYQLQSYWEDSEVFPWYRKEAEKNPTLLTEIRPNVDRKQDRRFTVLLNKKWNVPACVSQPPIQETKPWISVQPSHRALQAPAAYSEGPVTFFVLELVWGWKACHNVCPTWNECRALITVIIRSSVSNDSSKLLQFVLTPIHSREETVVF